MGGKTWQQDEEELFWLELIPLSPEGLEPSLRKYSWKEVAEVMHQRLGEKGYRNYNHQLIYEHFYQNCKSNHPSPRARDFVREYMERRGDRPIERPEKPKSKPKVVLKRRAVSDNAGPSEPKRARPNSEDAQEPENIARHHAHPHSSAYPLPRYDLQIAHAASQTVGHDGRTAEDYWTYRHPLPLAPRPDNAASEQRRGSSSYYSEPSTPIDDQYRPSTYHRESVSSSSGSEANHSYGRHVTGKQHAHRPVSLPPVTLEPRIGSLSNGNYRNSGARVALPPISVLTSMADAGRHSQLPELTTPTNHSSKWEALLNAASASSAEVSPNSIISHSELFCRSQPHFPVTTIPDDNATEVEEPNGGQPTPGCTQTEEQSAMTE